MNKLYKLQNFITSIMPIIITFAVIKLLWSIVDFALLPKSGVDISQSQSRGSIYTPFKLARATPRRKEPPKKRVVNSTPLRMLTLKGIYKDNINPKKSIAIISKNGVAKVASVGDEVFRYKLSEVEDGYVILEKGGKDYKLQLPKQKSISSSYSIPKRGNSTKKTPSSSSSGGGVIDNGDQKVVAREVLNEYKSDMNKIWKNISLVDYRENNKLKGFRVRFVKRKSLFEKLGLRQGDVIVGINGESINSYSLPMKMLSNIDSMDGLILQVKRGNNEVELEYEIR